MRSRVRQIGLTFTLRLMETKGILNRHGRKVVINYLNAHIQEFQKFIMNDPDMITEYRRNEVISLEQLNKARDLIYETGISHILKDPDSVSEATLYSWTDRAINMRRFQYDLLIKICRRVKCT